MAPPNLIKSIVTVAAGSAIGSAITFAVSPLITRLFSPSEFGTFAVILASVAVLLNITTARLELAVPLPNSDADARGLLFIGFTISVMTIAALGLVILVAPHMVTKFAPQSLDDWLIAVPALLVPVASFTLMSSWSVRQSQYQILASRNVMLAITTAAFQIFFGATGWGAGGLILGMFLGQLAGTLTLFLRSNVLASISQPRRPYRTLISEFRHHPLHLAPTGLVNSLGLQAPVLILAATYGPGSAGLYALTHRVLSVPLALVGQSVAQVYSSELAKSHRKLDNAALLPLFWKTTKLLSLGGALLVCVGGPVALFTFEPIFGSTWSGGGSLAAILCVGIAAQLVSSGLSQTLVVFRRTTAMAVWDMTRLISVSMILGLGWKVGLTLNQTIACQTIVVVIMYTIYWVLSYRTLHAHLSTAKSSTNL